MTIFQPSGLNSRFYGEPQLAFADYIARTRDLIAKARVDITPATAEKILTANTPFEFYPSANVAPTQQGLLLIHGLYDSPFMLKELGEHFAAQGLLVRSILLPGHGTIPGDLLDVHYSEWIKAVDYGVESLAQEVKQIFILGFSLGGLLALYKSLYDSRIAGILLVAPALALRHQWLTSQAIRYYKLLQLFLPREKWYKKRAFQTDYSKYESFPCNAAAQIYQLIVRTSQLLQKTTLSIPLFLTASTEDEVICPKTCGFLFKANQHPKSRLLWYTSDSETTQDDPDSRITYKSACFPQQRVLDFSHICLPISPENPHYGATGDYRNFLHYPGNKPPANQPIYLGALNKKNQRTHIIQRLSYNPDFKGMIQAMDDYLKQCTE